MECVSKTRAKRHCSCRYVYAGLHPCMPVPLLGLGQPMSCRTDIRTPLPRSPRPSCHCQLSSHPSGITCVRALASVHVHVSFPFPGMHGLRKGRVGCTMPCRASDATWSRSVLQTPLWFLLHGFPWIYKPCAVYIMSSIGWIKVVVVVRIDRRRRSHGPWAGGSCPGPACMEC
jgi:hypothetical protein